MASKTVDVAYRVIYALAPFEFERKKLETGPTEKRLEHEPGPKLDPDDIKPDDFDNPADFMIARGSGAVVEARCAELWPDYVNS